MKHKWAVSYVGVPFVTCLYGDSGDNQGFKLTEKARETGIWFRQSREEHIGGGGNKSKQREEWSLLTNSPGFISECTSCAQQSIMLSLRCQYPDSN